jgi:hypothetical protein
MRTLSLLLLLVASFVSAPGAAAQRQAPRRTVLFVGNSLTYVGNTPAVLDALASANGTSVSSDMIVRGGATLTQRADDGTVARALQERRYSDVVLQERGGDLMCAFGPTSCTQSRHALRRLVSLARRSGARVFLLGTYQPDPMASRQLVVAEAAAAREAGIPYVDVSSSLATATVMAPGGDWFAADGVHPGPALALLNAALLHQALLGKPPGLAAFTVDAPIYGTSSGLVETLRHAEDPPPTSNTPRRVHYDSKSLARVLRPMRPGPVR